MTVRPGSVAELTTLDPSPRSIQGTSTKGQFCAAAIDVLDMSALTGVVDFSPQDQMVTVLAGTLVSDLQAELRAKGQCLPLASTGHALADGLPGTVGGLVAANLAHGLEAQHGSPRDWVLRSVVLFGGSLAASGAKVVKSVAGFDVHKACAGSWGQLGPLVEVTLRTWPIRALASCETVCLVEPAGEVWVSRCLPSAWDHHLDSCGGVVCYDPPTCTVWSHSEPLPPDPGWVMGPRGARTRSGQNSELVENIKRAFDPDGRWV